MEVTLFRIRQQVQAQGECNQISIQNSDVKMKFLFRFPEYVCSSEPCGECADPDKYPCGNYCILNELKCPLTGHCSPTMFECGDQCLEPELVCDGKVDCTGKGGGDEQNCSNTYQGSWVCNGKFQSKTIPCL